MNINATDTKLLIEISQRYRKIHSDLTHIENQLIEISKNKDSLIEEIKNLRTSEASIINKIEHDIGKSLSSDDLMKILKSND